MGQELNVDGRAVWRAGGRLFFLDGAGLECEIEIEVEVGMQSLTD
jgi:hypothetical protein